MRDRLTAGEAKAWEDAFSEFFQTRLDLRYLRPIQILQSHDTYQGEGFTILAVQCSLVEFLESTTQGINYRYRIKGQAMGEFEYSSSKKVFIEFLSTRHPFNEIFSRDAANDFYTNVRCGLLHEARTKNGWRIWAEAVDDRIADVGSRIVYRNGFQQALLTYIENYRRRLLLEPELQRAFIRKYDDICE